MAGSVKIRKKRDRMFQEDPHCRNCGVLMIHPKDVPSEYSADGTKHIKGIPYNMATVQHKYNKGDPRRARPPYGEERWLLWCYACNVEHNEAWKLNDTG